MQLYQLSFPNGKKYIGITSKTAQERFKRHCTKSSKCILVKAAIHKYGKENVVLTVLATVDNWELLCLAEIEAIEKFNTFKPNGYNLTLGGDGNLTLELSKKEIKIRDREKRKNYYYLNKEKFSCLSKKYAEKNKEKLFSYNKKYRQENKDRLFLVSKEWRENNKEKLKKDKRKYHIENKELILSRVNEWTANNKEKVLGYKIKYYEKKKLERINEINLIQMDIFSCLN